MFRLLGFFQTYVAEKTLPGFAAHAATWFLPSLKLFHKTTEEVWVHPACTPLKEFLGFYPVLCGASAGK